MTLKRFVIGTLVGAATLGAAGVVMFGLAFPSLYTDFMHAGSATGVQREVFVSWAIALALLANGALITLAVATGAGIVTRGAGMTIGAVVNFLLWFTADFMLYGISNVGSLQGTLIDVLFELVAGALAGGTIALVCGKVRWHATSTVAS